MTDEPQPAFDRQGRDPIATAEARTPEVRPATTVIYAVVLRHTYSPMVWMTHWVSYDYTGKVIRDDSNREWVINEFVKNIPESCLEWRVVRIEIPV